MMNLVNKEVGQGTESGTEASTSRPATRRSRPLDGRGFRSRQMCKLLAQVVQRLSMARGEDVKSLVGIFAFDASTCKSTLIQIRDLAAGSYGDQVHWLELRVFPPSNYSLLVLIPSYTHGSPLHDPSQPPNFSSMSATL